MILVGVVVTIWLLQSDIDAVWLKSYLSKLTRYMVERSERFDVSLSLCLFAYAVPN